jgi:hypothetical protein
MKLGADPKKTAFLVALVLVAAYLLYTNVFSSTSGSGATERATTARPSVSDALSQVPAIPPVPASEGRTTAQRRNSQEFRPAWKRKGGVDPSTIDPKLRLDLLAKVQAVELGPAGRNLFQWGDAPKPELKEPGKIIPKTPAEIAREQQRAAELTGPTPPPPPPAIALKYYGYVAQRADGRKRAFFLDGDDIFVAAEGDLVKKRYKVVRIGLTSVVVEDTQFNNTQTLPLTEESAG